MSSWRIVYKRVDEDILIGGADKHEAELTENDFNFDTETFYFDKRPAHFLALSL